MDVSSWTATDIANYSLYGIAYITSIVAFSMSRIEWLRIIIIVSSACYALYYYIVPSEPLWLDVVTETGFVVLNICMLFLVTWQSSRAKLSDQEIHLHQSLFSDLPKHEFSKLVKSGEWQVHDPGDVLITDGDLNKRLFYIFSGETEVVSADGQHHTRKSGSVLGELAYRLDQPATGTVTVKQRSVCICWKHDALEKLGKGSANIRRAIDAMLSERMAMKLAN